MKRRIMQIAVSSEGVNQSPCLFALDDRGTVWVLVDPGPGDAHRTHLWHQMPPLPNAAEAEPC